MAEQKVTDTELRECLLAGLKPSEIARRFGISAPAVSKRLAKLERVDTAGAVYIPENSRRYTSESLDAMEQLQRGLGRVNLLMDACDEWLRDPSNPERYSVEPRAEEIDVVYKVEIEVEGKGGVSYRYEKRKKKLAKLFTCITDGLDEDGARFVGVEHGEYKHADPRELILKTAQEARQTVNAAAEIAQRMADARAMQFLREAIIHEISNGDEEAGKRIASAVRRGILLCGALGGPGELSPPTPALAA